MSGIYTSQDAVRVLYDRKTPRHGWHLVSIDDQSARALRRMVDVLAPHYKALAARAGQPQYQIGYTEINFAPETYAHEVPDPLPANQAGMTLI